MTPRPDVYFAVDTERDYQEALKTAASSGPHEIAAFLLYMDVYMKKAMEISSTDWSELCDQRTLDVIRKVTALGVACMEMHGAPTRSMPGNKEISARVSP